MTLAALALAAALLPGQMALPNPGPGERTRIIDGEYYLCSSYGFVTIVCRPAADTDTICIPDHNSGNGNGCHAVDLRKGFDP